MLVRLELERAQQAARIKGEGLEAVEAAKAAKATAETIEQIRQLHLNRLLEMQRQYNERRAGIEQEARAGELSPIYGEQGAEAIARMEQSLERQATWWARSTIALRTYIEGLEVDLVNAFQYAMDFQARFRDAFNASIDAYIQSAGSLRSAGQALVKALLAPWIQVAAYYAKFYAAKAIASAAAFDFRGAVRYGLAAAGFAVLGAAGRGLRWTAQALARLSLTCSAMNTYRRTSTRSSSQAGIW